MTSGLFLIPKTLRVRSVFGIKNSPDVTHYVTASTECHRLSRPGVRVLVIVTTPTN